jgi:deoxyribodipyrimidine photo-lyase
MAALVNIMWFRRDLRLEDNAALYHALKEGTPVVPIFIFDTNILDLLEDRQDQRVAFIRSALAEMQEQLKAMDSTLETYYGKPAEVFEKLLRKYKVANVFANRDYELYAIERDNAIEQLLLQHNAAFYAFKDQVIFEKAEVVKDDGKPYTVFTPYSKKWKAAMNEFYLSSYPTEKYFHHFYKQSFREVPGLASIGFIDITPTFPQKELSEELVNRYTQERDFPSVNGTSRMGVHLRFGTVSIREMVRKASELNETFLNELIWREFYQMILSNFPHINNGLAFKREYDNIKWRNDESEFAAWCAGVTGYPIVDAGMRELNATGFMHNRVRMITASFLVKHLLIDWRWGEAYFASKLLDYDFASNNGGWQWAAGSGCDAAPYFRVFNPTLQMQKFDSKFAYIRKWVPEFEGFDYPKPIVNHEMARKRVLEVYKNALDSKSANR